MPEAPDFEAMYRRDRDPFRVRDSWYERRKLAVVLASLSRATYALGWDPACGTGDLALALDARCERFLASDLSAEAVQITKALVAGRPEVEVTLNSLPRPVPGHRPDVIVLSEVLYYLPESARAETYTMVDQAAAESAAEILTVHWRHHPDDAYLSGTAVTDELGSALHARGWTDAVRHTDLDFVLASWLRDPRDTP